MVISAIGIAIFLMYLFFADFAFGIGGPSSAYKNRKWLSSWNIY
jgi:dolichyl-phosphate-mannose-protein mannosyltransferase